MFPQMHIKFSTYRVAQIYPKRRFMTEYNRFSLLLYGNFFLIYAYGHDPDKITCCVSNKIPDISGHSLCNYPAELNDHYLPDLTKCLAHCINDPVYSSFEYNLNTAGCSLVHESGPDSFGCLVSCSSVHLFNRRVYMRSSKWIIIETVVGFDIS